MEAGVTSELGELGVSVTIGHQTDRVAGRTKIDEYSIDTTLGVQRNHEGLATSDERLDRGAVLCHSWTRSEYQDLAVGQQLSRVPATVRLAPIELSGCLQCAVAKLLGAFGSEMVDHRLDVCGTVAAVFQHLLDVGWMDAVFPGKVVVSVRSPSVRLLHGTESLVDQCQERSDVA